ncbi:MAG: hypothetical protein KC492_04960, partial [Myxococcales bacterium]|nr:hypothetical protein [Myxococcales bacterium]
RMEVDVDYVDSTVAKAAGEQAKRLLEAMQSLGPPFDELGKGITSEVVDAHLVLRWKVSLISLAKLIGSATAGAEPQAAAEELAD